MRKDKQPVYYWMIAGIAGFFCVCPIIVVIGVIILGSTQNSLGGSTSYMSPREASYDLSPDGKHLIYTIPGPLNLFDLATKQRIVLNIPGAPTKISDPAFSPDGKTVAFAAESDLWLASLDGKTVRRLTHDITYSEFAPRFSPDGRSIVFARPKNNASSPTGVFWIEYDLCTIQRDGTHLQQITNGKYRGITGAQFTPDGRTITFAARIRTDDMGGSRESLLAVNALGKLPPREIFDAPTGTSDHLTVSQPTLSPDGKQFILMSDYNQPYQYDACLLQRDGTGFQPLHLATGGEAQQFRFSPDGNTIYFRWGDGIRKMTRTGQHPRLVTKL